MASSSKDSQCFPQDDGFEKYFTKLETKFECLYYRSLKLDFLQSQRPFNKLPTTYSTSTSSPSTTFSHEHSYSHKQN